MKRLTILFLALLSAGRLFPWAWGSEDARFLEIQITYRLNADGSWEREYRHRLWLGTYYAVTRACGETFIVYDPAFQKLEILKSETTMADGRKVPSPANAFNEVLPAAARGFADFSGLREMVVTHTGLEREAVVDLHYRLRTRPGFIPAFCGREPLVRDFPVQAYRLEIVVPEGKELSFRAFGCQPVHTVTAEGAAQRHAFLVFQNRTAPHEPLAPPQADPFIVFSTAGDWSQALALDEDSSPLGAALAKRVEQLKAQCPARGDLMAALQRLAAVEVQNCVLGVDATGWRPRPVERVAQSNYGTRLEKALLLRALLKRAGIDSEPLAIAAGPRFAADVPAPLQTDAVWLKVVEGPHALYLNPWAEQQEFFPYGLQEREAWNLERQAPEKLPPSGWEQNGVEVSGAVRIAADGVSGSLTVAARGVFNRYNEAAADTGKFIAGVLKKFFPVDKLEVRKVLQLTRREARVEAEFSGQWLKEIPSAGTFIADACRLPGLAENMVIVNVRESDLVLEAPFQVSLRLDLEPAAGLTLEYAAPVAERKNELGFFSRSLSAGPGGRLRFAATAGVQRALIGPDAYPRLRELLEPYFVPDFWLVFKKIK